MTKKLFIAGIDTGIGKTYVSLQLLSLYNSLGYRTIGLKPIATGAQKHFNDDALALLKQANVKLPYSIVNPYLFTPPIAPHIAAEQAGVSLSATELHSKIQNAFSYPADVYIVEGAGGWYVPLNNKETMADFVVLSKLTVILIVGIRLGCLNHTLLTYHAIRSQGATLGGWIANDFNQSNETQEIIKYLRQQMDAPYLGFVQQNGQLKLKAQVPV